MRGAESVAIAAAREAGALIRAAWRERRLVEHKGAVDLVTETDRQAEACIVRRLREAFPEHRIIAEESASGDRLEPPRRGLPVWYVDPLDGTTNFAHGFPQVAVSIALGDGPELLVGVVYDPLRDEMFTATQGRGAFLNGKGIRVSRTASIADALVATGFPYDRRAWADYYLGFVERVMRSAQGVRRLGAAALDLCWVACGRLDAFWEWKLQPWDVAAGTVIVREAGGRVTDFTGGPFDLFSDQILASNGRVHEAMVEILQAGLAARAVPW